MSHDFPPDPEPEMTAIEAALGSLAPAKSTVDRDAIMFRAGQRSAQGRWAWPSATAALMFVSLGEAALLATRTTPEPRIIERIVEVPTAGYLAPVVILRQNPEEAIDPAPAFPAGSEPGRLASQDNYHLREQALRFGVEGLPEPPPLAVHIDPARDIEQFRSEIRSLLDPGGTL